ncbi:predicted protein [Uncinocarpus reesii 1704]|uniref:SNF2 family helicase/ATPase n=1 Tax=Uncinocarpus reesii (strain UAMH 1704) TaxID=336963 RepID=C4JNF7_UNCRE|nr:uncharacterized protein UREG_04363 [Uncinocarpus reesii 1704]EEP79517.1 predicted protein [Uncinocarpus reesii 1704]
MLKSSETDKAQGGAGGQFSERLAVWSAILYLLMEEGLLEDRDPFDWSIDEVVAYLCHGSFDAWSRSKVPPPRPNPVFLERTLRENDITGHVLLTEINKQTLAEDFGIKSLGQRATIAQAVQYLQGLSRGYRDYAGHLTSADIKPENYASIASPAPLGSPHLFRTPNAAVHSHEYLQRAASFGIASSQQNTPAPVDTSIDSSERAFAQPSPDRPVGATAPAENPTPPGPKLLPDIVGSHSETKRRRGEHYVTDKDGKKRRRLELTSLTTRSEKPQTRPRRYLDRKKAISTIFYDDTMGDGGDSEEDTFIIEGSDSCPIGYRHVLNQRMRYYFRQRPQYFKTKEGKPAIAVFPYDGTSLSREDPRFFSLFIKDGKKVNVTRENVSDWPEFVTGDDELHYLLTKYPPKGEHDALPVYGESASEGDYDSETWKEIQEEHEQTNVAGPQASKFLSQTDVDSIIDSCIADFVGKWQSRKRPIEERKARRIWRRARAKQTRLADIKAASNQIAHMDSRLKELRKAIKVTPWSQAKDVRMQCQSMEQTVFEREHHKWIIEVLEREKCPLKVPGPNFSQPKPLRSIQLPDDEESLGSDTDNSGNDTDDFIVPDEDPTIPSKGFVDELPPSLLPTVEESDEDEVVSARKKRKSRRGRQDARKPARKSHAAPSSNKNSRKPVEIDVVDLTRTDSEDGDASLGNERRETFNVRTPPLNSKPRNSSSSHILGDFEPPKSPSVTPGASTNVADLDFAQILESSVAELEKHPTHLIVYYVHQMGDKDREGIKKIFNTKSFGHLKDVMCRGLRNMSQHETTIPGHSNEHSRLYMRMAICYISWVSRKRISDQDRINKQAIEYALQKKKIRQFLPILADVVRTYAEKRPRARKKSKKSSVEDTAESNTDSDMSSKSADEEADALSDFVRTPHRKRKRAVKQSQEAINAQKLAQRRVQLQEEQQQRLLKRFQNSGVANSDPIRQAISFDEPVIYLDPHIGRRVKQHQLHGMQFMWRELIKDEKRQGCLLAHTMGLGKTMQVISLLVTIANVANSQDPELRKQIPDTFRESRTLILCPSSLIENWWEEFLMWRPGDPESVSNLGPIRKILQSMEPWERLKEIAAWHSEGGVLLLSYDIFRAFILNRATKSRGSSLGAKVHETIKKQLLDGPNIIVADEAHKMKNRNTGIAEAASGFKSKSRIALTGSPLANHLEEYYSMINWIAPGYLGDFVQFKAKYVEPIEAGLYRESTRAERRESLKRLQVLKKDLDPKVNRADISVLKGDLPPKVEFVITLPLTAIQEEAYKIYVATLSTGKDDVPNARLWAWLAILSLLCNHPSCFMEKILKKNRDKKQQGVLQDSENESVIDDITDSQTLGPEVIKEVQRVFEGISDLKSTALSHRATMLEQIVKESVSAGDKVLVFSHSIPTLNYLEHILKQNGWTYCRLDGTTPISSRQVATKYFNRTDSPMQVYLISTKAGGLGLNIPGANRVIIFDFAFNPTWEEQAVGRAYRFGQTKPVFVYRFVSGGTYEDAMYNRTVFKTQLSFRVIDKKNPIRYASKSKKAYLFPPKEVKQRDLSEFKGKDPKVLDKILQRPNFAREIALTETFQREDNDALTPEEEQAVQAELDDERLKRNDPEAWARKEAERLKQQDSRLAMEQPYRYINNVLFSQPPPRVPMPPTSGGYPMPGPVFHRGLNTDPNIVFGAPSPLAAQLRSQPAGSGPPPLQPDTSLYAALSSQPPNGRTATYASFTTDALAGPSVPPTSSSMPAPPVMTNMANLAHNTTSPSVSVPPRPLAANIPGSVHHPSPAKLTDVPVTTASTQPIPNATNHVLANPSGGSSNPSTTLPVNDAVRTSSNIPVQPSTAPPSSAPSRPAIASAATSKIASQPTKPGDSSKNPVNPSPAKRPSGNFDGADDRDSTGTSESSANSAGSSPKTPIVEENPTRCATQ